MATADTPERTIAMENVGPIRHLAFPLTESGGVTVLAGRNGRGKTTALAAVDKLTTGRGNTLSVRKGQVAGQASGLGVTLTLARSVRRKGELEVETLDSRLSVADLVDPKIKDPGAADSRRIKSLVSLSGAKADIGLFAELLPEPAFSTVITADAIESTDLIEMASRVKRDIESKARRVEDAARKAHAEAEALATSVGDIDTTEAIDEDAAAGEFTAANGKLAALNAQRKAAFEAGKAAEDAQDRLQLADATYDGPTVEAAAQEHERAQTLVEESRLRLEDLRRQCANASEAHNGALNAQSLAAKDLELANNHVANMDAWREAIGTEVPLPPDPAALEAATERLTKARAQYNRIPLLAKAKDEQTRATAAATEAEKQRELADRLREAGRGADEVLSNIVAGLGCPLRVEAGRLLVDDPVVGEKFFADLSAGERWRLGLDIAVGVAGSRTVFTVPQEAWEALDPINQEAVHQQAAAKGVDILTAEATDDEDVVAREFGAEGVAP
ncbi:MAG: AAA family ATPase [bacterium]|nr:AAA family ATPase [bacterium]